jgi:hypothetical protein
MFKVRDQEPQRLFVRIAKDTRQEIGQQIGCLGGRVRRYFG